MDPTSLSEKLQRRPPRLAGAPPPCAVLALLAGDRLILEVRSSLLHTQPGEICLPGGRMEADETVVQCALRETEEELGISPHRLQVLGSLDYHLHTTGQTVYPVLAYADPAVTDCLCPNPAEVAEVFAVPLEWFRARAPIPYEYRLRDAVSDTLPPQLLAWARSYPNRRSGVYWQYGDKLIWGLTARIIRQLLELTEQA